MYNQLNLNMCIWNVKPEERHCNVCKVWHCKDRPSNKRTWTGLTKKLLSLNLWESFSVPSKSYNSVKSQICRYNKAGYGRKWTTIKIGDSIFVQRIK